MAGKDGRAQVVVMLDLEVDVLRYTTKEALENSATDLIVSLIKEGSVRTKDGLSLTAIHGARANLANGPNYSPPGGDPVWSAD